MNRNKPTYIATATTTVVRSQPGRLHTVTVQGGTTGTIIGYDNASAASGDIVFSFDSTEALQTYTFDVDLNLGLTVITGQATKLTISTGV